MPQDTSVIAADSYCYDLFQNTNVNARAGPSHSKDSSRSILGTKNTDGESLNVLVANEFVPFTCIR